MSNFTYSAVPRIRHSRSRFDLSHSVKTSANVGTLYPFEVQEVYAGDTFKVNTSCVSRLSSQFLKPVMDNMFLDVYYFFVPSRLLYDKFVNIFGENTDSSWANTVDYECPNIFAVDIPEKSVGDYLGLPTKETINTPINILPFRAFAKVYNEWFRDENNIPPMHIQTGEVASSETPNTSDWSPSNYFGMCPKVAKFHDLFTSSLPAPQKGSPVSIGLSGNASVTASGTVPRQYLKVFGQDSAGVSGRLESMNNGGGDPTNARFGVSDSGGVTNINTFLHLSDNSGSISATALNVSGGGSPMPISYSNMGTASVDIPVTGIADLSSASAVTVNDLRFAFQYQKMLERDARGGTRYTEYLQSHFGVSAGDSRLQRSEFLGGKRSPISIHQVTQTTGAGSETSPLAEVGAFSLSNSKSRFTKGFVEHGYVIGVFCIRQFHTYQQGVEKFWNRIKRTDFYDPVFANIGEQPVMATQLYGSAPSDLVFGYNEAWVDLRTRPGYITGQMRSNSDNSFDVWHFADNYATIPVLSETFINETPIYVDRAISVSSTDSDQFLLDFYVQNVAYRSLPTYSVPSLIDHN